MLKIILTVIMTICIIGCAGMTFTERNVNIVTAKNVEKYKGATDITDTFTFEGMIYVLATFTWDDVEKQGGYHKIKAKWYSGDKLISVGDQEATFGRPPWYVCFWTSGTSLGVGKAKVEIYADGLLVGSKDFEVFEK